MATWASLLATLADPRLTLASSTSLCLPLVNCFFNENSKSILANTCGLDNEVYSPVLSYLLVVVSYIVFITFLFTITCKS